MHKASFCTAAGSINHYVSGFRLDVARPALDLQETPKLRAQKWWHSPGFHDISPYCAWYTALIEEYGPVHVDLCGRRQGWA